MTDIFAKFNSGLDSPVKDALEIVPADTADLAISTRVVYVGTSGDLRVTLVGAGDGTSTTFVNMPTGWHPIRVKRVWATGTTATQIVGGW